MSAAKDVTEYMRREKFAKERQEEFWRETALGVLKGSLHRDRLEAVAAALGIPTRPPAEWKSQREREIEELEREQKELAEREARLRRQLRRLETP